MNSQPDLVENYQIRGMHFFEFRVTIGGLRPITITKGVLLDG
jgi:hypothetical protein